MCLTAIPITSFHIEHVLGVPEPNTFIYREDLEQSQFFKIDAKFYYVGSTVGIQQKIKSVTSSLALIALIDKPLRSVKFKD